MQVMRRTYCFNFTDLEVCRRLLVRRLPQAGLLLCLALSLRGISMRTNVATRAGDVRADRVLPVLYRSRPSDPGAVDGRARIIQGTAGPMTVVIMAHTNPANMMWLRCYHASLAPLVQDVLLVWNGHEAVDAGNQSCLAGGANVVVLQQEYNTLLNRYRVYDHVKTEAVILLDDDHMVDRKELLRLYALWAAHPSQVIGVEARCVRKRVTGSGFDYGTFPRLKWVNGEAKCNVDTDYLPALHDMLGNPALLVRKIYHRWYRQIYFANQICRRHYELTIGSANLLHRNYMQLFMAKQPVEVLEHIYFEKPTCEDIALHFIVSNTTGLPPVASWSSSGLPKVQRGAGLSGGSVVPRAIGWSKARSECVTKFAQIYGRMPLVSNSLPCMHDEDRG